MTKKPYELELEFTVLPRSLNMTLERNRWLHRNSGKRWDALVRYTIGNRLPDTPLQKAHITLVRAYYRTLDYDGLVGSMKVVVDALVTAKVLIDDSWKVTGKWDVDQVFRPLKDGPLLTVKITEVT